MKRRREGKLAADRDDDDDKEYNILSPVHPGNLNPLFHRIITLAAMARLAEGEKMADIDRAMDLAHRYWGAEIHERLDREPDPKKAKSKSVFTKYRLATVAKNIEIWGSPEGTKFIAVTNGSKRRGRRKVYNMIFLRKMEGMWFEFREPIER